MESGWSEVEVDGLPVLDGETVYIGVNVNGYVGAFNLMNGDGTCLSGTPEGFLTVMSGLKWWRRHDGPGGAVKMPDEGLRAALPPFSEQEALRLGLGLARACRAHGLVLNVEQRPLLPLAMGHYETHVRILPGRRVVA